MTIVPASDLRRRERRRDLTLDLFTRSGTFWQEISQLRTQWNVEPTTQIPPEPPFDAEAVGLLTRSQMPERFHLPPLPPQWANGIKSPRAIFNRYCAPQADEMMASLSEAHLRTTVFMFLKDLEALWKAALPDDNPNGANVFGWMSWSPFLSACVLYDPPDLELEIFAEHDDQK